MRWLFALPLLAACSGDGDDDGTQTALACEDIELAQIGDVAQPNWPNGVDKALENYRTLGGTYLVDNTCGAQTQIKLTVADDEAMEVVVTPWEDGLECGFAGDPSFEADSSYDVVAVHNMLQGRTSFEFFIQESGEVGIDEQNNSIRDGQVTFFGPADPLQMRAYATAPISPLVQSDYEEWTAIVRVTDTGAITADIVLTKRDGSRDVCSLLDPVKLTEQK